VRLQKALNAKALTLTANEACYRAWQIRHTRVRRSLRAAAWTRVGRDLQGFTVSATQIECSDQTGHCVATWNAQPALDVLDTPGAQTCHLGKPRLRQARAVAEPLHKPRGIQSH
jgi:hypothetical protein